MEADGMDLWMTNYSLRTGVGTPLPCDEFVGVYHTVLVRIPGSAD